jgi:hypothetical protein
MKTTDYSTYSLEEMNEVDQRSVSGGIVWTWNIAAMMFVVMPALANPQAHIDSFLQGVSEGYNAVKSIQ